MQRGLLLLLFASLLPLSLLATHNRAGEISYRCLGGYQYEITVTTYTKASSSLADRCEITVYFGDGDSAVFYRVNGPAGPCSPPSMMGVMVTSDIKQNVYIGAHTYPGPGSYYITMTDPNRTSGIMNIPNSVNTPFQLEAYLWINPVIGTNNYSPQFTNLPLDLASAGQPFVYNPGAAEQEGDSLVYKEMIPMNVPGYSFPSVMGGGTETMDAHKGDYAWNAPSASAIGDWDIMIRIEEWRCGYMIGYVTREMLITVTSSSNNAPVIGPVADTSIVAGSLLSFPVAAADPDNNNDTLTAMSDVFSLPSSPATFSSGNFQWTPACSAIREEPYRVVFKATDDDPSVARSSYRTMLVTVKPAAPAGFAAGPGQGIVALSWTPVTCGNVVGYNIYRKQSITAGSCDTNIANYSFYFFLSGVGSSSFTDYSATHYQYCYILTPVYSNGCETFEGAYAYTQASTIAGIENVMDDLLNISLFPNPSDGKINIRADEAVLGKNAVFKLYNDLGELVMTAGIDKPFVIVDVSEQSSGLYWYRIEGQGLMRSGKIMIIPGSMK